MCNASTNDAVLVVHQWLTRREGKNFLSSHSARCVGKKLNILSWSLLLSSHRVGTVFISGIPGGSDVLFIELVLFTVKSRFVLHHFFFSRFTIVIRMLPLCLKVLHNVCSVSIIVYQFYFVCYLILFHLFAGVEFE